MDVHTSTQAHMNMAMHIYFIYTFSYTIAINTDR